MQIKATMRYHLIQLEYQKEQKLSSQQGSGKIGTPVHCWWNCEINGANRYRKWYGSSSKS